jgi:TctA family transporter
LLPGIGSGEAAVIGSEVTGDLDKKEFLISFRTKKEEHLVSNSVLGRFSFFCVGEKNEHEIADGK